MLSLLIRQIMNMISYKQLLFIMIPTEDALDTIVAILIAKQPERLIMSTLIILMIEQTMRVLFLLPIMCI